jgi:hypothetical protein
MSIRRIGPSLCAIACLLACPAQAQELQVSFITVSPIPIDGWISVATAGILGLLAHRALLGRARTLGAMIAVAAGATGLAWHAWGPSTAHAGVLPVTVMNLTSSPASVILPDAPMAFQLTNTSTQKIRIESIERVNAVDWTFISAPEPACEKQQELRPGQFCFVALAPIDV